MRESTSNLTHPGRILRKEMKAHGFSQADLAATLGISPSMLSEIFAGNKEITAEIAVRLEMLWGSDAKYWNDLQASHNLAVARAEALEASEEMFSPEESATIAAYIPKRYFADQGLLNNQPKTDRKTLLAIFGIKKISQIKQRFQESQSRLSLLRASEKRQMDDINKFGWESLVRHYAREKATGEFDPSCRESLIEELNKAFFKHAADSGFDVIGAAMEILESKGIAFVVQPKPAKCPIDGFAFMVNDPGHPAIAMTIRYKRLDNFAFTLMHELGHVFLHLGNADYRPHLDDLKMTAKERAGNDDELARLEFEADQFAQSALIPDEIWEDFRFVKKTDPSLLHFAERNRIHPGILRGRLCNEKPSYYKRRTMVNAMNKLNGEFALPIR